MWLHSLRTSTPRHLVAVLASQEKQHGASRQHRRIVPRFVCHALDRVQQRETHRPTDPPTHRSTKTPSAPDQADSWQEFLHPIIPGAAGRGDCGLARWKRELATNRARMRMPTRSPGYSLGAGSCQQRPGGSISWMSCLKWDRGSMKSPLQRADASKRPLREAWRELVPAPASFVPPVRIQSPNIASTYSAGTECMCALMASLASSCSSGRRRGNETIPAHLPDAVILTGAALADKNADREASRPVEAPGATGGVRERMLLPGSPSAPDACSTGMLPAIPSSPANAC